MSAKTATFKAAMIQMRSGLVPAANIDAASRLIAEAKAEGADYVQTPEMTNLLAANREQLFATVVEEKADPSLAAFRDTGAQACADDPCRLAGDQAYATTAP